jgi:hypothetical protein
MVRSFWGDAATPCEQDGFAAVLGQDVGDVFCGITAAGVHDQDGGVCGTDQGVGGCVWIIQGGCCQFHVVLLHTLAQLKGCCFTVEVCAPIWVRARALHHIRCGGDGKGDKRGEAERAKHALAVLERRGLCNAALALAFL